MGGPRAPFACDTGFIVQLASAQQQADYQARISAIRSARTLPANARWTTTTDAATCDIFTGDTTFYVLYAGPFTSADQGCATRLAGPPDAFIRSDTVGVNSFYSCVCPAQPNSLPYIAGVGQSGVWVGELRTILMHLQYSMDEPTDANYGVYTAALSSAVARFQSDSALEPTGQVNEATWSALATSVCAG